MSVIDVDRRIAAWLRAEAPDREPDHLLAAVLARTERTRRRPGWLVPERWLPMSTIETQVVPAPRIPWRVLGAVALIVLALAVGAIVAGGGTPRPLPAPFGPAANGLVAFEADGDIFTVDPATGEIYTVTTGAERDTGPMWSRDGTRLAFVRRSGDKAQLYVAGADGAGARPITEPLLSINSHSFSPDGREVLFVSGLGSNARIGIGAADGSGTRFLDLGMPALDPAYRPPDGRQIAFVGTTSDATARGLFVVNTDGMGLRTLVEPARSGSVEVLNWSPDGMMLAYGLVDFTVREWTVETHVMHADGSGDRTLPAPGDALWNGTPVWSNDGTRLAVVRGYSPVDASDAAIAVIPVDGRVTGVESLRNLLGRWPRDYAWAPDDSSIVVVLDGAPAGSRVYSIDPDSGMVSTVHWDAGSRLSWQRVAP